jgi:hypothetical protein
MSCSKARGSGTRNRSSRLAKAQPCRVSFQDLARRRREVREARAYVGCATRLRGAWTRLAADCLRARSAASARAQWAARLRESCPEIPASDGWARKGTAPWGRQPTAHCPASPGTSPASGLRTSCNGACRCVGSMQSGRHRSSASRPATATPTASETQAAGSIQATAALVPATRSSLLCLASKKHS